MASVELLFKSEQSSNAGYAILERLKSQLKLEDVYFGGESDSVYLDYAIDERKPDEFDVLKLKHTWDEFGYECAAVLVADSRTFEQALKIVALGINGRRQKRISAALASQESNSFVRAVS